MHKTPHLRTMCLKTMHLLPSALLLTAIAANAESAEMNNVPHNVMNLSASGQVQVPHDWLQVRLKATREGSKPAQVQQQLQETLEEALKLLRSQAQGEEMQLQSGNISVNPHYTNQGKINAWQGRAEIIIQGRDFARITQAAAQISQMELGQISFSLSKEAQGKVLEQAQTQAVAAFSQRAAQITSAFGLKGYTLREIHVSSPGSMQPRFIKAMAMSAPSLEALDNNAPMPLEPGISEVVVEISGSVQMH